MKAMILAAGVGKRMRPLTDITPKPLLPVAGTPLIEHHIRRLAEAGFSELVINVAHLGQQIVDYCGDGSRWGVSIVFSVEDEPLETAGGIIKALPHLGDEPFLIVNGDVWTEFPFASLRQYVMRQEEAAHLVMVDNPPQHPRGDFRLDDQGWLQALQVLESEEEGYTYAGIGLYDPSFFAGVEPGKLSLLPLFEAAIAQHRLGGRSYHGAWTDVGTPKRLQALDIEIQARNSKQ